MTSAERVPRISVLIPVYRDWEPLRQCLAALAAQNWPAEDFEVIAINNDVAPPPAGFEQRGVILLHAPEGHSYSARNAGLAVARGAVLAFTDADCRPDAGWLAAGWAALQQPGAALAGGRIRIAVEARNLATDFDQSFAFRQAESVRAGSSVTANLFVKRDVFDAVGGFNGAMQSGGDFEFCRRARQQGFMLVYADDAVVWHPARDSLAALFRKNRRVAGGLRRDFELQGLGAAAPWRFVARQLRPRLRYWYRLLTGREKTEVLPAFRRPAVVALQVLLHYHFAWSMLRAPPRKDQH